MNLHLFNDEKVVNRTMAYFEEALPNKNKFIVLIPKKNYQLKYVTPFKNLYCLVYGSKEFWSEIGDIGKYKNVIIHFLDEVKAKFICNINHDNIIWVAWGADLYNLFLERKGYVLYQDKNVKKYGYSIKRKLFYPLTKILDYGKFSTFKKAIQKINSFAGLEVDFSLLKRYYPKLVHLKYIYFFYYPIDHILSNEIEIKSDKDIMVGNSGSLTANHEMVFSILSQLENIQKYKIYCPLSYGNKKYINYVKFLGQNYFCNKFIPLINFLPLEKYNKILMGCNSFVYGNFRQEAVGNIVIALYLGKKVFLHKRNPLFDYYKSLGVKLFELSDLPNEVSSFLDRKDQLENKRILWNYNNYNLLIKLIQIEFQ